MFTLGLVVGFGLMLLIAAFFAPKRQVSELEAAQRQLVCCIRYSDELNRVYVWFDAAGTIVARAYMDDRPPWVRFSDSCGAMRFEGEDAEAVFACKAACYDSLPNDVKETYMLHWRRIGFASFSD